MLIVICHVFSHQMANFLFRLSQPRRAVAGHHRVDYLLTVIRSQ
jgi:hypothetical protein